MRELDDGNSDDHAIKAKICEFCQTPSEVHVTRTATNDMALIPITKDALLSAARDHICAKRRVFTDRMDNNDVAYIIPECAGADAILYVKAKFFKLNDKEQMLIISAHPPRRWW